MSLAIPESRVKGVRTRKSKILWGVHVHSEVYVPAANVFIISDAQPPTTHPNRNSRTDGETKVNFVE
jgi:hypothetical protein